MTSTLKLGLLLSTAVLVIATAYGVSSACDKTIHAWQRTFHGPYALDQPLRSYYVPRLPGACAPDLLYHDCLAPPFPPEAATALGPGRMERLGAIPNDLGLEITTPSR